MKLASPISCTACMACVDSCHHDALNVSIDRDGFYCIEAHPDKCVECGLCGRVCPVLASTSVDREEIRLSHPYAAWCTDDALRSQSASGGAFAALAKAFLKKGAVVYGAAVSGFEVRHRRIETEKKLPLLLGSKYQLSRMDEVYRQVKADLRSGRIVLYSGLSCQVAGVLNFVGEKLLENLFTIDTICGGISTMLPMLQMQFSDDYTSIHSFRNKDNGWKSTGYKYALKMDQKDGTVRDLGMDNMVLRCFCHKETKRPSCLDCHFNGFHRPSDATIGDFWGDTRFSEQHAHGLSVIVTHSERLNHAGAMAYLHTEPITWQELIARNQNVYWSHPKYLIKSLSRKMIFRKLRVGDDAAATRLLEQSNMLKRIEAKIFFKKNEQARKSYLQRILDKTENK